MVDNHQQGMADRDDSFLPSTSNDESLVLSREVGVLCVDGGMSCLNESGSEPGTPFARLA
jgi:hypothetical protein